LAGVKWKKDATAPMEIDNVCDVDENYEDPQLCATLASDIYMHLREAEVQQSSSTSLLIGCYFENLPLIYDNVYMGTGLK
jgi:cyclin A